MTGTTVRRTTAAVLTATGTVECRTIELPAPRPHELLVRVLATGICGSDLATYRGFHPYKKAPVVLGHELCAVVEEVGEQVTRFRPGDKVCSAAFSHCGRCADCARGATNLCRHKDNLCHLGWEGSFAEHLILRENMTFALNPAISAEAGALVEPLSIGLHAAALAHHAGMGDVAVLGSGTIGLACAIAARQRGADRIVCVDIGPRKAELATAVRADGYVDASTADVADGVRAWFPSRADVTFVASGHPGVLNDATRITRPGGQVVVVSYFDGPHEVELNSMVSGELTLRFSALSTPGDFAEVIDWLATGTVDPVPLVTHRFPLAETATALRMMDYGRGEVGKVLLIAAPDQQRHGREDA
ncbi:zinc-dependent alcohol dehydrogenase [Saccharopolyspora phatthalungensis]|uniref:2-desacetyl-2-hydroxyethyl bacteriochlorophyllide A dehydrogenase n=1 Tax=Saccharopolyspora phatthalungensis TaxID=664693 RepID=A0A840QH87_9PSEU|nr:alcohol dehydrogenase catalytic domain-containing protein [Saccharopolyspora phatthalungensis]MBB5159501.1 2-desacetyl-2-hydroxyethyl bacteriochlorophyllide A dehydrogenase [Saccharopolyspora phatthalungensis]